MKHFSPKQKFLDKLNKFKSDASGQISVMFILLMIPLAAFIGGALDFSQQVSYRNKLQATLDSVSIAVAKAIAKDSTVKDKDLQIIADGIYSVNHTKPDNIKTTPFTIVRTKTTLTVEQSGELTTAFMRLVGTPTLPIDVVSIIDIKRNDVEISLVLDVTGSMVVDSNFKPDPAKLNALKSASKDLIETLITTKTGLDSMRIALVPWSAGVNVRSTRKKVIKNNASGALYCAGAHKTATEASPVTKKFPVTYFWRKSQRCSNREIIPLTKNKSKLLAEVDKWDGDSNTASDTGLNWGWGTLSPKWNNYWKSKDQAKAYDKDVKKFIVLMTDGVNTVDKAGANKRSKALCKAMKAKNILIYTIGFQVDDAKAVSLLQDCASIPSMYINAASGAELKAAFKKIADEVGTFYISG